MKNRNLIGSKLKEYRKQKKISQRNFVAKLHLLGLDLDHTSLCRIESHSREVYDYELAYFSIALDVDIISFYKDINI